MLKYWADKWQDALNSGEYTQTNGALKRVTNDPGCGYDSSCGCEELKVGFCCLGVLTDVVLKEMPQLGQWSSEGCFVTETSGRYGISDFLPPIVRQITGITDSDPILYVDADESVTAASANDGRNMTFEQIAEKIGENYQSM